MEMLQYKELFSLTPLRVSCQLRCHITPNIACFLQRTFSYISMTRPSKSGNQYIWYLISDALKILHLSNNVICRKGSSLQLLVVFGYLKSSLVWNSSSFSFHDLFTKMCNWLIFQYIYRIVQPPQSNMGTFLASLHQPCPFTYPFLSSNHYHALHL